MQVLQQLRPFIWFCQVFGVIPFFVVTDDSPEKKVKNFSFSLCHPVTLWYSFLFICLIVFPILDSEVVWRIIYRVSTENVPMTHSGTGPSPIFSVFVLQENAFSLILLASTRYIICKHDCFRRAISLVRKVHNELMVEDMPSPSVQKHVIAAIIYPLIAGITIMASNTTLFNSKVHTAGLTFAVLIITSRGFTIVMLLGSFMLTYLCYYIVAFYIRLIALNVEGSRWLPADIRPVETVSKTIKRTAWIENSKEEQLRKNKRLFGYLCQALIELNNIFSFPVFIFLTLRLISSSFSLYVAIYGLMNANNSFFRAVIPSFVSLSTFGLFSILIIFRTADLPIIQMRKLKERIYNILNGEIDLDMDTEFEALMFLKDISEDRVRISAAGLFLVGMNLVPSLTAAIITYLIILLEAKLV